MKVRSGIIGNLAWARLQALMDDELGNVQVDPEMVAEAELCLALIKAIALGQKRIQIDLTKSGAA